MFFLEKVGGPEKGRFIGENWHLQSQRTTMDAFIKLLNCMCVRGEEEEEEIRIEVAYTQEQHHRVATSNVIVLESTTSLQQDTSVTPLQTQNEFEEMVEAHLRRVCLRRFFLVRGRHEKVYTASRYTGKKVEVVEPFRVSRICVAGSV